jgi:hypothetical protein
LDNIAQGRGPDNNDQALEELARSNKIQKKTVFHHKREPIIPTIENQKKKIKHNDNNNNNNMIVHFNIGDDDENDNNSNNIIHISFDDDDDNTNNNQHENQYNNESNNNSTDELMEILKQLEKKPNLGPLLICLQNLLFKSEINRMKVLELLDTTQFTHLEDALWKRSQRLAESHECFPIIYKLINKEKDDVRLDRRFCEQSTGELEASGKTLLMALISDRTPNLDLIKLVLSRSGKESLMKCSRFDQTVLHHLVLRKNAIAPLVRGQIAGEVIRKAPGLLKVKNHESKGGFTPLTACDMEQSRTNSHYVKQAILSYMAGNLNNNNNIDNNNNNNQNNSEQMSSSSTRTGILFVAPRAVKENTPEHLETGSENEANAHKRKAEEDDRDSAKKFKDW